MTVKRCEGELRILVVDDQVGIRRLLFEILKDDGYTVDLAGSGEEAIDKIIKQRPALVMLDLKMPGMNGLAALQEIVKIAPKTQVLLMTAYRELEIAKQAEALGVTNYLTKPFDIYEVRQLVKELLAGK